MKKKIIVFGVLIVIVAIFASGYYIHQHNEYERLHYAEGMSEAAARASRAADNLQALNEMDTNNALVNDIVYGNEATQKSIIEAQAKEQGIKLKVLSPKKLQKLKDKNKQLKEEAEAISKELDNLTLEAKERANLLEKYTKKIVEYTNNDLILKYNETYYK